MIAPIAGVCQRFHRWHGHGPRCGVSAMEWRLCGQAYHLSTRPILELRPPGDPPPEAGLPIVNFPGGYQQNFIFKPFAAHS